MKDPDKKPCKCCSACASHVRYPPGISELLEAWVQENKNRGIIIDRIEFYWDGPEGSSGSSISAHPYCQEKKD